MRLILNNNELSIAPEQLLRQAGYAYLIDRRTGNESFVRPLNRGYYPRFHLYLDKRGDKAILNLHLDQKQASYQGAHAHNAEYDGELVAEEMERIERISRNAYRVTQNMDTEIKEQDLLDKIRPKVLPPLAKREEKKSWWKKFFA